MVPAEVQTSKNQIATNNTPPSLPTFSDQYDPRICLTNNLCTIFFMDDQITHDMTYCNFMFVLNATHDQTYDFVHISLNNSGAGIDLRKISLNVCEPPLSCRKISKNEQGELNVFAAGCCVGCLASLQTWLLKD